MPTLVILMIVGAAAFSYWSAGRAAAEHAEILGREACRAAGVQLLDQSVHAIALRLRRRADGRLGLERTFRFDYSTEGDDRRAGRLVLHGDRLVAFSGPVTAAAAPLH